MSNLKHFTIFKEHHDKLAHNNTFLNLDRQFTDSIQLVSAPAPPSWKGKVLNLIWERTLGEQSLYFVIDTFYKKDIENVYNIQFKTNQLSAVVLLCSRMLGVY